MFGLTGLQTTLLAVVATAIVATAGIGIVYTKGLSAGEAKVENADSKAVTDQVVKDRVLSAGGIAKVQANKRTIHAVEIPAEKTIDAIPIELPSAGDAAAAKAIRCMALHMKECP